MRHFQLGGARRTSTVQAHGLEQKWFAVTGRVVAVKVEADGDLRPSGAENIKTIAVLALDVALANEVNAAT